MAVFPRSSPLLSWIKFASSVVPYRHVWIFGCPSHVVKRIIIFSCCLLASLCKICGAPLRIGVESVDLNPKRFDKVYNAHATKEKTETSTGAEALDKTNCRQLRYYLFYSNMEERNSTTFDAKQFVSNCSFLDFSNLNDQSAVSFKRFLSNSYDLHFVSLPTLSSALSLLSQMSITNLSLMLEEKNQGQSKKRIGTNSTAADMRCQPSDMDMYIFVFER